jgi:hypothetical protein
VEQSDVDLDVVYSSGTCEHKPLRISSVKNPRNDGDLKTLEIRILSPAFFSRFVHYAHTSEAFDRECTFTDVKNRTIWFSRPDFLPLLLQGEKVIFAVDVRLDAVGRLRWNTHRRIRSPPATPIYTSTPQAEKVTKVEDIRRLSFSSLDRFLQAHSDRSWLYRRQCMRLFLAQRFTLGFTAIIDGLDFCIRVWLIQLAVSRAFQSSSASLIAGLNTSVLQSSVVHILAYLKGTD